MIGPQKKWTFKDGFDMFEFLEPGDIESNNKNYHPKSKKDVLIIENRKEEDYNKIRKEAVVLHKNYVYWRNFHGKDELFYLHPESYFILLTEINYLLLPE